MTAPHVRLIFARRLAGLSTAGIARELNERRIPSPGVYHRVRNPHRAQAVWTLRVVAAILANPRYTDVGGAAGIAAQIRRGNAVIVCGRDLARIRRRHGEPGKLHRSRAARNPIRSRGGRKDRYGFNVSERIVRSR
ncbi:recombinase family protein [Krasilnikovia cinnamomea]|uniref:recombinase family protein n=1 Tax=Krasilnikovia cinnamomea TaxID=349313 RepID=UPI0013EF3A43|nr:recombinase family protein [Krasilnikovia cinnamomea]